MPSKGSAFRNLRSRKLGSFVKNQKVREILESLPALALVLLAVLAFRSSVVEAFKIPSGSMIPTLLVGDHIFLNKFAYGFRIPFSDWITGKPINIIDRAPPQRGDVIVFRWPENEKIYYIKRVIGQAGDQIEVRNKVLYINNQMMGRDPVSAGEVEKIFSSLDDPRYSPSNQEVFMEHLGKKDHYIMLDRLNFGDEQFGPYTVPENSLFVMGDNRDFSSDSRRWGPVPMKNVMGKAMVIWLSFWPPFAEGSPAAFRPERIGTLIH